MVEAATNHPVLHRNLVLFQSNRLKKTYSDFVKSERFKKLTDFFFDDVYSPEDKTERDHQFKSLYEFFRSKLGESLTRGIGELVELNDLSRELDLELLDALAKIRREETFDEKDYEEGYRRCENYKVRVRQIEMLGRSIRYFRSLAERRTIGIVLKTVLSAASLLGGRVVIGFLKRGYDAYRSVTTEEAEEFVRAVEERERARLDRIYRRPKWESLPRW